MFARLVPMALAVSLFPLLHLPHAVHAQEPHGEFNIVNGTPVPDTEYPEVVLLEIHNQNGTQGICGGTILEDQWILTAAHCFEANHSGRVIVHAYTPFGLADTGETFPVKHRVAAIYEHPSYRAEASTYARNRWRFDIALLKLFTPISQGKPVDPKTGKEHQRPAGFVPTLPTTQLETTGAAIPRSGENGLVVGRGTSRFSVPDKRYIPDTSVLKQARVPFTHFCVTDEMVCAESPIDLWTVRDVPIADRHDQIRHRNPGSCFGDSGGPLYDVDPQGRRRQVGVVSGHLVSEYTYQFWQDDICGRIPVMYTSIAYLRPWIDAVRSANLSPGDPVPNPPLTKPPLGPTGQPGQPQPPQGDGQGHPNPPSTQPDQPGTPPGTPQPPASPQQPGPALPPAPPQPPVSPQRPPGSGNGSPGGGPGGQNPAQPAPAPAPVPPVANPEQPSAPPVATPGYLPSRADDPQVLRQIPKPAANAMRWIVPNDSGNHGSDLAIGINRLRTAFIAQSPSPLAAATAPIALIASETTMADALASGALQSDKPLYLTQPHTLEPRVLAELTARGTQEVWLLGGPAAVHPAVETALHQHGIRTKRIAGQDRTQTAAAIATTVQAQQPGTPAHRYVARAFGDGKDETRSWADSIALGALAAKTRTPVVLTASAQLSDAARNQLTPGLTTTIIGGEAAISAPVAGQIGARTGQTPKRIAGANRADTAKQIASHFPRQSRAIVIDGQGQHAWQLGFTLAGLASDLNAPILLTAGSTIPPETQAALRALRRDQVICMGTSATCDALTPYLAP